MDNNLTAAISSVQFLLFGLIVASMIFIVVGVTRGNKSFINKGFKSLIVSFLCLNLVSMTGSGELNNGIVYLANIAGISPKMLVIDILIAVILVWLIMFRYLTSPGRRTKHDLRLVDKGEE